MIKVEKRRQNVGKLCTIKFRRQKYISGDKNNNLESAKFRGLQYFHVIVVEKHCIKNELKRAKSMSSTE